MADLNEKARVLVAAGKEILSPDASGGTIKKPCDGVGAESTEDAQRAYRELLFKTPQNEQFIGDPGRVTPPPVDLGSLGAHWRVALNSAQDALRALAACSRSIPIEGGEIGVRTHELTLERQAIAQLLERIALDEHLPLHNWVSDPRATKRMLGLPETVLACVFDLDGVLTASAAVHARAWTETFEEVLAPRFERAGERFTPFRPFDPIADYDRYILGKPRLEGVHAFLASRGLRLPHGQPEDKPGAETIYGLANRKKEALVLHLEREGVAALAGSRRYLEALREAGLRSAVVSASTHTETILERAGLAALIDRCVDGDRIQAEKLRSKPAPDTLLAACRDLGVPPNRAAAFETSPAGLAAAHAAGFGFVVGVERTVRDDRLSGEAGDPIVADLAALLDPALL